MITDGVVVQTLRSESGVKGKSKEEKVKHRALWRLRELYLSRYFGRCKYTFAFTCHGAVYLRICLCLHSSNIYSILQSS